MEQERYVLRKLIPSKGFEPLTVKFRIETRRPQVYKFVGSKYFEDIEFLAENNFADDDPYMAKDGYDGANYYACKEYDKETCASSLVYIAAPNAIRVKKSRREREREREYER